MGKEVSATPSSSSCLNLMSYSYVYTDDDSLVTTGTCSQAWYYHYDPEDDDWGLSSAGCFGKANFGCQSCDGSDVPWCEAVDADGEHTGWCYCSDEDGGAADVSWESFDGTNTEVACVPAPEDEQNPFGPIDGA